MTLQDDFTAALEQVAAAKQRQINAALAVKAQHQERAQAGGEWFRAQFELLDADYQPAEPLPATDPEATDFNNFFGLTK